MQARTNVHYDLLGCFRSQKYKAEKNESRQSDLCIQFPNFEVWFSINNTNLLPQRSRIQMDSNKLRLNWFSSPIILTEIVVAIYRYMIQDEWLFGTNYENWAQINHVRWTIKQDWKRVKTGVFIDTHNLSVAASLRLGLGIQRRGTEMAC